MSPLPYKAQSAEASSTETSITVEAALQQTRSIFRTRFCQKVIEDAIQFEHQLLSDLPWVNFLRDRTEKV